MAFLEGFKCLELGGADQRGELFVGGAAQLCPSRAIFMGQRTDLFLLLVEHRLDGRALRRGQCKRLGDLVERRRAGRTWPWFGVQIRSQQQDQDRQPLRHDVLRCRDRWIRSNDNAPARRSECADIVEKSRSCASMHSTAAAGPIVCGLVPGSPLMRLRLLHRLFLAFAALSMAALAAFVVLQQDGFRRGFLDYLDGLSAEQLEEGSRLLADRYAIDGDWEFLRGRPRLLMDALGFHADTGRPGVGPPRPDGERPPPFEHRGEAGRPLFEPGRRPPPPRSFENDPLDIGGRLLLVDAQGIPIAGNPNVPADARAVPVQLRGHLIGTLRLAPLPHWRGKLDEAFARSQWRRGLIGGVAILLCALLLAWWLARWLQKPIRALALGAQALAAGDFAARVPVASADELGELTADFNRLALALERSQTARRQWGADIAHELRTPLAILHGEIQALQDGVRVFGPGTLASLQAETTRLTALVEDLYHLALSDAGALEYRRVELDLGELLRELVRSQQATMGDAGIALGLATLPDGALLVRGDAARLTQLFANLIANARRYTDAPGRVQIGVERSPGHWRILVDDTPPGVADALLPHLFDRLFRVDGSRNRSSGGAGLGLAIARNIVDAHGGSIAAARSPLGGLRIDIRLPIAPTGRS